MRKRPNLVCTATLLAALALPCPVFAVVSVVGNAVSTVPIVASIATVGGVGVVTTVATPTSFWGGVVGYTLTSLAIVAVAVDPPTGTFYDGQFTFHYDPTHFQVNVSGWLGDWGANPALSPPPANLADWTSGLTYVMQDPAPGLLAVTSNDPVNGLQSVSFDWGLGGHSAGTGPF